MVVSKYNLKEMENVQEAIGLFLKNNPDWIVGCGVTIIEDDIALHIMVVSPEDVSKAQARIEQLGIKLPYKIIIVGSIIPGQYEYNR